MEKEDQTYITTPSQSKIISLLTLIKKKVRQIQKWSEEDNTA